MSLPRFLVSPDALTGSEAILTGAQLNHLRARRLRVGSLVVIADGVGGQRQGTVTAIDRRRVVVLLSDVRQRQRDSALQFTLAQALLKGEKLDWVVEKATELGATALIIFASERTVGRVAGDRLARWTRVARSAAEQSHRSTVPSIIGPTTFEAMIQGASETLRLLFWEERPVARLTALHRQNARVTSVLAAIGPEGGFSSREAERAASAGFQLVGLSPRILRAETAAVAAATLCQFLWGDLDQGVA